MKNAADEADEHELNHPVRVVLPDYVRQLLEPRLPGWTAASWYGEAEQALALTQDAEVAWLDLDAVHLTRAISGAARLKWLCSIYSGLDHFPLQLLRERGVMLTNGAGLAAASIAEFVLMAMLAVAKSFPEILRAQARREWLADPPGKFMLHGSRALIIGYGSIGRELGVRLSSLGVEVVGVRRRAEVDSAILGPDSWRSRLGEFDWVVIAAPATRETQRLIGAQELAMMKPGAYLINIARGTLVDQEALIDSLRAGQIGGAVLDVTEPEPLPQDSPLWSMPDVLVTMHLSARAQTGLLADAARRFLTNLERYRREQPLDHEADLTLGY